MDQRNKTGNALSTALSRYEEITKQDLIMAGFRYDSLTDEQLRVICEPDDSPESYYCDGEVSEKEAKRMWKKRLVMTGLTAKQVKLAIKYNKL